MSEGKHREPHGRAGRVLPKSMAGVDSMPPGKALVLGVLRSAVVPENQLIALSAGLIVGQAGFSGGQAAVVIVLFTAIATSTVRCRLSPTSWHRRECAGHSRTARVAGGDREP